MTEMKVNLDIDTISVCHSILLDVWIPLHSITPYGLVDYSYCIEHQVINY